MRGVLALVIAGAIPSAADAQRSAKSAAPLVFDGVTVVDVEHGTLHPAQRVIIAGARIQAVGPASEIPIPQGAETVDAQGKYLIPGLWDMHAHVQSSCLQDVTFPLLIATGVTGIRDLNVPSLDTALRWRREIAAGVRVGPRTVISGPALNDKGVWVECAGGASYLVVDSPERARHIVDSLQAAGADLLKIYTDLTRDVYFAIAAEARRVGIPFAGHVPQGITPSEASDSGQRSFEHSHHYCAQPEECAVLVARLKRNGTWMTPTLYTLLEIYKSWNAPEAGTATARQTRLLRDAGLPMLVGTDDTEGETPGMVQKELETLVHEGGLTPLEALQAATLNPAAYLRATDSLGTIAPGKLADLVLLDANPLDDITNVGTVRAVVANGRYFDRAALDRLLAGAP